MVSLTMLPFSSSTTITWEETEVPKSHPHKPMASMLQVQVAWAQQ
jgi:hypothetical protein